MTKYMLLDDEFLDEISVLAQASDRLRMNRDLRNSASDTSQRMLNALEIGTLLPIHRHTTTSETQILLRGKIDVMYYDGDGHETRRFRLDPKKGMYGINIPVGVWHNLEVIESSVLFEAKDGSYTPLTTNDILTI